MTLPALRRALDLYDETILFTRTAYHSLLCDYSNSLTLKDIDSDLEALGQVLPDSDVITFWQDEEWKRELMTGGCRNLYFLESRPAGNTHFSAAMFSKLGWDWLEGYSKRAWIGDHWSGSRIPQSSYFLGKRTNPRALCSHCPMAGLGLTGSFERLLQGCRVRRRVSGLGSGRTLFGSILS